MDALIDRLAIEPQFEPAASSGAWFMGTFAQEQDPNFPLEDGPAAEAALAEQGVRCVAISPTEIRLVTHRDVGDEDVERASAAAGGIVQTR